MSIIVWIIIGGLAGWVAGMIMKEQGSLAKNIIVGIVGALSGGFIMSFFGAEGFTGFNLCAAGHHQLRHEEERLGEPLVNGARTGLIAFHSRFFALSGAGRAA